MEVEVSVSSLWKERLLNCQIVSLGGIDVLQKRRLWLGDRMRLGGRQAQCRPFERLSREFSLTVILERNHLIGPKVSSADASIAMMDIGNFVAVKAPKSHRIQQGSFDSR